MTDNDRVDPAYTYIDGKVRTLKGQITRLRNRTEALEASGLQEQITSLDSQLKSIDSILLRLERNVAHLRISHNLHWALWAFGGLPQDINVINCIRFARESASAAMTETINSNEPHEVADGWYSKCSIYFRSHGNHEIFV